MTPVQIEQSVFELEDIRIVIRADKKANLGEFEFVRKAAGNSSINEWIESRLAPILNGHDIVVVDGTGAIPSRRTKLSTLRASYDRG